MSLPVAVRSVLAASDLGDGSERVVAAGARLAEQIRADLHVIHALEVPEHPFQAAGFELVRMQSEIHQRRAQLHEQVGRIASPGRPGGTLELSYRAAHRAVLERAREVEADLIVLGHHRAPVPGSHLLGTTAQRVMEGGVAPCLVTREPVAFPLQRVLLALDEPDLRRGMLGAACHWLAALREQQARAALFPGPVELRVLHVARSQFEWNLLSDAVEHEISRLRTHPRIAANLDLTRRVVWSRAPADQIVEAADQFAADLILMGMRERGPLLRALLGSVSSAVLRQATAPVLLLPPRLCELWQRRLVRVPALALAPEGMAPAPDGDDSFAEIDHDEPVPA